MKIGDFGITYVDFVGICAVKYQMLGVIQTETTMLPYQSYKYKRQARDEANYAEQARKKK